MARPYEKEIEEMRDKSDKESNKKELFKYYQKLNPIQQQLYVKELIFQFEEYIEKAHYQYLHYLNEEF